jgi:hypothetical protein
MRVKLDENLPASLAEVFLAAGHDVSTVVAQKLSGKLLPRSTSPPSATTT